MNDKKTSEEDLFVEDTGEDFHFEEEDAPKGVTPPPSGGGGAPRRGPPKIVLILAVVLTFIAVVYFVYKFFLAGIPTRQKVASGTSPSSIRPTPEQLRAMQQGSGSQAAKKAAGPETAAKPTTATVPSKEPTKETAKVAEIKKLAEKGSAQTKAIEPGTLPNKMPIPGTEATGKEAEFNEADISKAFAATGVPPPTRTEIKPGQSSTAATVPEITGQPTPGQAAPGQIPHVGPGGNKEMGAPKELEAENRAATGTAVATQTGKEGSGSIQSLQKELFNAPPPKAVQEATEQAQKLAKTMEQVEDRKSVV